jgi:hypothetical protein
MPARKPKRGPSVKTKEASVRTPKNSNFRLGATRAPAPANAGNVGLGGKTGVTTPKEKPSARNR